MSISSPGSPPAALARAKRWAISKYQAHSVCRCRANVRACERMRDDVTQVRTRSHSPTLAHSYCRVLTIAIFAAIVAPGCSRGPVPPKRGQLDGKLTVNGKPVANGTIRFMALAPGGMNVLATVKDGQYSVPAAEGPTKGKYRVEISVPSATKRKVPNDDIPGQWIEE